MKMPSYQFTVWKGPLVDASFETLVQAKKHAAWLVAHGGGIRKMRYSYEWHKHVRITGPVKQVDGSVVKEFIPYDDYEFKNGESRKIS